MKLQGNVTVHNHLKGSISAEELLGFIRQTVAIPADANVSFRLIDGDGTIAFDAHWSAAQRGEEQELAPKAVTTVAPPANNQHEQG